MTRRSYVEHLKNYYDRAQCGYSGCCKTAICGAVSPIVGPREPFIGNAFGNGRFPRLVVLSLDPGRIEPNASCNIDRVEDGTWVPPTPGGKTRHWWRTLQLVYSVLGEKALSDATDADIASAVNWLAHLNSARCTQNKDRHAQADRTLFDNCREFVQEELGILKPQILITQGDRAWDVVAEWASNAQKFSLGDSAGSYIRIFEIAGQPCRHVHFYHPGYRAGYFKQHTDLVQSGVLKDRLLNDDTQQAGI